jgi:hypothetical protein
MSTKTELPGWGASRLTEALLDSAELNGIDKATWPMTATVTLQNPKKCSCTAYLGTFLAIHSSHPGVFGADIVTMQQFMWQLDIVGVAHFVMDCFDYLDAASPSNQP